MHQQLQPWDRGQFVPCVVAEIHTALKNRCYHRERGQGKCGRGGGGVGPSTKFDTPLMLTLLQHVCSEKGSCSLEGEAGNGVGEGAGGGVLDLPVIEGR